MQIKLTIRCHLTPVRVTIINKTRNITKFGDDVERRKPSHGAGGNVNWCSHDGKQYAGASKIKNITTKLASNLSSGYPPEIFENVYS